ncbi:hypothetical protein NITHO_5180003 [Nitrolancea hollandica Lb]|uniref:Uncharacterized protein n=1 Tax=Nitrolancea hollandica Lb TaxID=1129897 RepID=I4ELN0_9BACT|nr:hypothetical protein NITHO_5180003 [Nitrolancea hollandica Lb]
MSSPPILATREPNDPAPSRPGAVYLYTPNHVPQMGDQGASITVVKECGMGRGTCRVHCVLALQPVTI